MKKILSLILIISVFASLFSSGAVADEYEIVDDVVYYNADYGAGGGSNQGSTTYIETETPHGNYRRLDSDGAYVRRAYGSAPFGPTGSGALQGTTFRYSVDLMWEEGFSTSANTSNSNIIEFNYYKSDGNEDWYIPVKISSDGTLLYLSGSYTASSVTLSLDKWYKLTFDLTFSQNETNTLITDVYVTDEETGEKSVVASDLTRNNVYTMMDKITVVRNNMGDGDGVYLYADNLKWSKVKKAFPEISAQIVIDTDSIVPAGSKIQLAYETKYATGLFETRGGCVKVFNNGIQIETLSDEEGIALVPISEGINNIVARIYDGEGNVVASSDSFEVSGISLGINESTPGYTVDFDEVENNGTFRGTGLTTNFTCDDPDTQRGEGKVAYRQYGATETSNLQYQTKNVMQYDVLQGRFFEVSADIKSNAPTNKKFDLIYLNNYYALNPVPQGTSSKWTAGMIVLDSGKLACYSETNVTNHTVDLSEWHNYKIIFDTMNYTNENGLVLSRAYYYVDDVLVYCIKSASNNFKAIGNANIGVTCDGVNAIDLYVDNVTVRTYDEAFIAEFDVGREELDEVPYENFSFSLEFSKDMNEQSFSNVVLTDESGEDTYVYGEYDSSSKTFTSYPLNLKANTEYVLDIDDVCAADGAGGTKQFEFKTQKLPFSIREISETSTGISVTLNNRSNEEKSAIIIAGYYDDQKLHSCSVGEITATQDRQVFYYTVEKADDHLWAEVYLIDSDSFAIIDKYIGEVE